MKSEIFIASDHAGIDLKKSIISYLKIQKYSVHDLGPHSTESVDYPDYASKVCQSIQAQNKALGILICGTGIGMSIAANKIKGIRAALVHSTFTAEMSKKHNNANVLCLGARILNTDQACEIVMTWLNSSFEGGRHENRVQKINLLENT